MPSSIGLMNSLGMLPPLVSFSKTYPSPGAGSSSILACAVLSAAARLLDVLALALGRLADRLLVGDLGLAHVGLDPELALEAVHDDLEVELAHAGDLGLAGVLVRLDLEGRVFLHQLAEALAELLLVGLGLGLDGERDDGGREVDRLQHDGLPSDRRWCRRW